MSDRNKVVREGGVEVETFERKGERKQNEKGLQKATGKATATRLPDNSLEGGGGGGVMVLSAIMIGLPKKTSGHQ